MKKLIISLLVAALLTVNLAGCKKQEEGSAEMNLQTVDQSEKKFEENTDSAKKDSENSEAEEASDVDIVIGGEEASENPGEENIDDTSEETRDVEIIVGAEEAGDNTSKEAGDNTGEAAGENNAEEPPENSGEAAADNKSQNLNAEYKKYFGKAAEVKALGNSEIASNSDDPYQSIKELEQLSLQFALKVKDHIEDPDYVYSPLSTWLCLAMYGNGLSAEGAEELASVLLSPGMSFQQAAEKAQDALAVLKESQAEREEPAILSVENLLLASNELEFNQDYVKTMHENFAAGILACDFKNAPSAIEEGINAYVSEQTRGMISPLLNQGAISTDTVLTLLNIVYFKGVWQDKFEAENNELLDFKGVDKTEKVQTMVKYSDEFSYYEDEKGQYLALPYDDNTSELQIFLPKDENADIRNFEEAFFTNENYYFNKREGLLKLPRFEIETSADIKKVLKLQGLDAALEGPSLNKFFKKLSPEIEELKLSQAFQKAKIKVDEEGSEASAATAMIVDALTAMPLEDEEPFEMIVDRPFLFSLKSDGLTIFMGRVETPQVDLKD